MSDADSDSQDHSNEAAHQAGAWAKLHLWQMQPVRDVLLGLGILALFWLGQTTSVVTVPLLLAILLAYLFEPVICWLMDRFGISRRVSVIGILVSIVLFVLLPLVVGGGYAAGQLVQMSKTTIDHASRVDAARTMQDPELGRETLTQGADPVPEAWIWVYDSIRSAESGDQSSAAPALDTVISLISENQERIAQATANAGMDLVNRIVSLVGAVFGISFMLFLTAFFFFFTATEWVQLKGFGHNLLPDKNRDTIVDLLEKFDAVISGFIRGRITIAFLQSIVFSIGYFLIGVPGAFILGPAVAILSIVPYLALIGLPISVSLLALQTFPDGSFRGEWWWILGAPAMIYFVGQALDDYVWTPMIQGKSTGMDTPTILFASLAGGAVFGIFGLLIAIPIAACVKILIQEIFWPRFKAWAEGRADDPLPIE